MCSQCELMSLVLKAGERCVTCVKKDGSALIYLYFAFIGRPSSCFFFSFFNFHISLLTFSALSSWFSPQVFFLLHPHTL